MDFFDDDSNSTEITRTVFFLFSENYTYSHLAKVINTGSIHEFYVSSMLFWHTYTHFESHLGDMLRSQVIFNPSPSSTIYIFLIEFRLICKRKRSFLYRRSDVGRLITVHLLFTLMVLSSISNSLYEIFNDLR